MALSPEMQAQIEMQNAIEDHRAANQAASEAKRAKIEVLRMAKEVLVENRRTKTIAEAVDIKDDEIVTFANTLTSFVDS